MLTIEIECPENIFDVEDACIQRARRVPVWAIDKINELRVAGDVGELYAHLAQFIPRWKNVIDPVTGEELASPGDDPTVFARLDVIEQLPWLVMQLRANPKKT